MSYLVAIPDSIREKISNLAKSKTLETAVLELFERELKTRKASELGNRVVAPVRCAIFSDLVVDPETEQPYRVTAWINDTSHDEFRIIIDVSIHPARD